MGEKGKIAWWWDTAAPLRLRLSSESTGQGRTRSVVEPGGKKPDSLSSTKTKVARQPGLATVEGGLPQALHSVSDFYKKNEGIKAGVKGRPAIH